LVHDTLPLGPFRENLQGEPPLKRDESSDPFFDMFERGRVFESPDAIGALSYTPLSSQNIIWFARQNRLERGKG